MKLSMAAWAMAAISLMAACNGRTSRLSDEALLDSVERRTFGYFWEGAEPNSGLARERIHVDGNNPQQDDEIVTTGGSGFGNTAQDLKRSVASSAVIREGRLLNGRLQESAIREWLSELGI